MACQAIDPNPIASIAPKTWKVFAALHLTVKSTVGSLGLYIDIVVPHIAYLLTQKSAMSAATAVTITNA